MLENNPHIYNKENNKLLKSLISVSAYNLKKAPTEEELLVGELSKCIAYRPMAIEESVVVQKQ